MFSVIIPTIQKNLFVLNKLLEEVNSSRLVDEIILINNHSSKYYNKFSKLRVIELGRNIYVNPAWNLGIKEAKNEYIAILNDDIFMPKEVFNTVHEFICKNNHCGLIGLDSLNKSNIENDNNCLNIYSDINICQTDIRNFCWGCAIFGKKDNFYTIPDDLNIWYGDDYLFRQNILNNKTNYKLISQNIKHYHSLSSSDKSFDKLKKYDIINWEKYSDKKEIKPQKHKIFNILGIKLKIRKRVNRYDLFVSLGSACACATVLKLTNLRTFSSPFDWLFGSTLQNRVNILVNDFKDFINKEDLVYIGTREEPEPRRIYKNKKNGLVFNHDFSYTNSLDEDYYGVYEKYKRRTNRLNNKIKNSNSVCFVFVQNPNERKEILNQNLLDSYKLLENKFPHTKIKLLYLFCERGLEYKNATKILIHKNILQIRFDYDAYNRELPYVVNMNELKEAFKHYKLSYKSLLYTFFIRKFANKFRHKNKIQKGQA